MIKKNISIYLDHFSWSFLFLNLKLCYKNEILIIGELSTLNNLVVKSINFLGFNFKELKFVAGHLTFNNENVFLKGREIAGKLAIDCSAEIISSSKSILNLNKGFNQGTIELFMSRYLHMDLEKWVMKILVVLSINEASNSDFKIYLRKPLIFNKEILFQYFIDIDLSFYSHNFLPKAKLYLLFITSKFSTIKFLYYSIKLRSKRSFNEQRNSVLCIQSDTIGLDSRRRRQPQWLDLNENSYCNTYILSFGYKDSPTILDEQKLSQNNCYVVFPELFLKAFKENKNNAVLKKIFSTFKSTIFSFLLTNEYSEKFHLLQINNLFLKSYLISAIAIDLKTRVFIINEPQSIYSDALVLVSDRLGIKSIALQYSNMSIISPLMMSNANIFCIFSEIYESVFSYKNIRPERFLITGYLYSGRAGYFFEDSVKTKEHFKNLNVHFTLCYFDENIQIGKFVLYNDMDHKYDIERLATAVIENSKLGVVVKTQFNYNRPSILYQDNIIIQEALKTGRFIDIGSGKLRNDIFAAQMALSSDLSVGHSYGATASLEAAVYGINSVLISHHRSLSKWDYLYNQSNILYDSIESVIKTVVDNDYKIETIGNWSGIISKFHYSQLFSAKEKINNQIKELIK